ncbi:carbohydrate ABC transporter permease [Streptacidiphilus jiangxiensis]|uniref:Xylobiose transport system permease protein n=1 Tax=Streptacidiphilus jiangxiensis TaxID=235985 RepID=A0A1H8AUT8_STRJI|nr:sugar ABC transporter permease [Streptacidiphilus jiangxiensis]SEM74512.1 xylobiose transport system permease protein [Streptacidiphilus jiangxiensis]
MTALSLAAVSVRRRRARRAGVGVTRPGFAWAVPATVFFLLFAILPLVLVAVLSFTSWDGISSPHFNGLANWTKLINDPVMTQSIWLTLLLTVLGVVTQTPVSILLGVWAAGPQRNRAVLSAIFFVPLLLSATAVSVLWRALLDPNFGIPGQLPWLFGNGNLLGSQAGSIAVLTFVGMWQFTPLHALLYQGGARAVPQVLYQAAAIDGAGTVRQFFHITLPQLRNTMITSVILMVVGGLTTFDTVLILTQGGPGTDTTVSAYYMYQQGFKEFDFGAGSAIALVLVVVATLISLAVVRITGYGKMSSTAEGI